MSDQNTTSMQLSGIQAGLLQSLLIWKKRIFTAAVLLLAWTLLLGAPNQAAAYSGTISGEVRGETPDVALTAATVAIEGTDIETETDQNGVFVLRSVPSGDHTLLVSGIGYTTREIKLTVYSDEQQEMRITLEEEAEDMGNTLDVFSSALNRGKLQAIEKQKGADGAKSVLSSEQIDLFTDYSAREAVARMPGFQVNRHRDFNIRGIALDGFQTKNVTIDGQRMATTGAGGRSINISSISVDMIQDLEVVKVVTPDMDAHALAGGVNINTRRKNLKHRELGARIGGGANQRYFEQSGLNSRVALNFSDTPRDDIFYDLSLSYQSEQQPGEMLEIGYDAREFESGWTDVVERISPSFINDHHSRLGSRLQLTYQPSHRTVYNLHGVLTMGDREIVRQTNNYIARGDWESPNRTGAVGDQGLYQHETDLQELGLQQHVLQASARHLFDGLHLEYHLGWSRSEVTRENFFFPFEMDRLDFEVDMTDPTKPEMRIINRPLRPDGTVDPQLLALLRIDRVFDDSLDNTWSAGLDLELPFSLGSLKAGASGLFSRKESGYNEYMYTYFRRLLFSRFSPVRKGEFDVFDQYYIPRFVDGQNAKAFYTGYRPHFLMNEDEKIRRSQIWNYSAAEDIYAGYGMSRLAFGNLKVLLGARVEITDARYEGQIVEFDDMGFFVGSEENPKSKTHTHIFPNAQLAYAIGNQTSARLAYSKTIARAPVNMLAPFELILLQDSTLHRGNPDLDPVLSNNIDLQLEHFFGNTGALSLGLFYKELSGGFPFERQIVLQDGDYSGWIERKIMSGDEEPSIYGLEVFWQQPLSFLPGYFQNLSLFANYTWTHSRYEISRQNEDGLEEKERVSLPGQSPHVVNAALMYQQGRLSTQLSYHWTAPSLYAWQQNRDRAPSIDPAREIYLDQYQDGWTDLSFSFRFRISNHFQFWMDVSNLLGAERVLYGDTRDIYPYNTIYTGGQEFRAGIRYHL